MANLQKQKHLFELLQEQQEPFDFEAHLPDVNGCSSKRLQSWLSSSTAVGFFRSLFTRLLHRKPGAFSCFSDTGSAMTPDVSFLASRGLVSADQDEWMEPDSKQLMSPVSVLDQFHHKGRASSSFKEDGSSSSTTSSSFDSPRDHIAYDHSKEEEEEGYCHVMEAAPEETQNIINDELIISWQRPRGSDAVTKLVCSGIAGECSKDWSNFGPEATNQVGIEIESSVFDEIVDGIVLEMIVIL